jgi:hypothetical protein
VDAPESIEGMLEYDWPVNKNRSPPGLSGDADLSAAHVCTPEAVPGVTAPAGSAITHGGALADLEVLPTTSRS